MIGMVFLFIFLFCSYVQSWVWLAHKACYFHPWIQTTNRLTNDDLLLKASYQFMTFHFILLYQDQETYNNNNNRKQELSMTYKCTLYIRLGQQTLYDDS